MKNRAPPVRAQVDVIAQDTFRHQLHLLKDPSNEYVSSTCQWKSPTWNYDEREGGAINWAYALENGRTLMDPEYSELLDSLRRFEWSRYCDCRDGEAAKFSGASTFFTGIRYIANWMVMNSYMNFAELTPQAFSEFVEDFSLLKMLEEVEESQLADAATPDDEDAAEFIDADEEDESFGFIYRAIHVWRWLWKQSTALARAHIPVMLEDPLSGRTSLSIAKQLCKKGGEVTLPLPDEVALPITNCAHVWLDVRAADIIRLHKLYMFELLLTQGGVDEYSFIDAQTSARLNSFEFSCEGASAVPWHEPIKSVLTEIGQSRVRKYYSVPSERVRNLVDALVGACAIVIHSESAFRTGELRDIPFRAKAISGLPSSITKKTSVSGLNELFYVESVRSKGLLVPKLEQWLVGARPTGTEFVPGPVRAIQILEELLAPWRELSGSPMAQKYLFLAKRSGHSLPLKASSIVAMSAATIRAMQRKFISIHVDLSGLPDFGSLNESLAKFRDTRGACILPRQWRTTFAVYMIRVDRRMLPVVQQHFRHMDVAMTDSGYVGANPQHIREQNSQRARAAAQFMYAALTGFEPVAGRIAKLIDEYQEELRAVGAGGSANPTVDELQLFCEERNIRVFDSPHGNCFIGLRPVEARCHKQSGTNSWRVKTPNFGMQMPDVCNGCACFGVDLNHADFHINRYVSSEKAWLSAKQMGLTQGFRVIQERAETSKKILRTLRVAIPIVKLDSP